MSSRRWFVLITLVAMAMLVVGGCGEDDKDPDTGRDDMPATSVDDAASDSEGEPTAAPEPVPAGELPPIQILSPTAFLEVVRSGSIILTGTAQVFEGTLRWAILDAKLAPIVRGTTTATCGAPCRGTFRARISLARVPIGSWELHVWAPDAAGGDDRQHDTMVPITVVVKQTDGSPAPGEIPPGGVPR